jgi:hypothetical protein
MAVKCPETIFAWRLRFREDPVSVSALEERALRLFLFHKPAAVKRTNSGTRCRYEFDPARLATDGHLR